MTHDKTPAANGTKGEPDSPDYSDDSEVVKKHRALINQDSVTAEDYPSKDRKAQSLVQPKKKKD